MRLLLLLVIALQGRPCSCHIPNTNSFNTCYKISCLLSTLVVNRCTSSLPLGILGVNTHTHSSTESLPTDEC